MKDVLRERAFELGARLFGVADLTALQEKEPELLRHVGGGFTRAIVLGIPLNRAVLEGLFEGPTPMYAHHYQQVNYLLDRMTLALSLDIQDAGFSALAVPASQMIRNRPAQGHLSHKLLGWFAGLGHIGRSTLLVNPRYGAGARYVSILTDMPLVTDAPSDGDCGDCRACQSVCPVHAIGETPADYNLDVCHRQLESFAQTPFVGQRICGLCVKVCGGTSLVPDSPS